MTEAVTLIDNCHFKMLSYPLLTCQYLDTDKPRRDNRLELVLKIQLNASTVIRQNCPTELDAAIDVDPNIYLHLFSQYRLSNEYGCHKTKGHR